MNAPLPQAVVTEMARRDYRMHQLLWRDIRRYWNGYPRDVQEKIRAMGWEPPRPSRDENLAPLLHNDSGEDFFYMQKQMIRRVNRVLTRVGDPDYPQVEGWVRIPAPDDSDYPVPPPWFDPGSPPVVNRYIQRIKTDVISEKYFRNWERIFSDPSFLRGVSLGTLGGLVEYYVLDPFRRRWAEAPGAVRPAAEPPDTPAIAPDWDDPRYDFLSDFYSMHVNPIYWRFAGWCDDRVEEWKYANGVFGDNFWTGTWLGVFPEEEPATPAMATDGAPGPAPEPASGLAVMEDLARTLAGTGLSSLHEVTDLDLSGADAPISGGHGHTVPRPVGAGHGHS